MGTLIHILHLEDDPADAELIQSMVEEEAPPCRIILAREREEYDQALRQNGIDIILADFKLPMYDGMSALRLAKKLKPEVPFIFVSGTMGEEAAIEGLTQGATDYVLKHNLSRLPSAIKRALREALNRRERQEAEAALRASEARYIDLYENAPDMYISINAQTGVIEKCNQTLADKLGRPKEEIIGRAAFDIYHPDCLDQAKAIFQEFLQRGMVHDKELQLLKTDGSKLEVSLNASAVRAEDGTILSSRSTLRDITERRRNRMINAARLRLMQFAVTHSLEELLEETLNEAENVTDSRIGFYHFVGDDQQSVVLQNWSTRTKLRFCKAGSQGLHYPIAEAGVWVDCVHQRKPVVHNDYNSLPHRKGMPEGHADVVRELVVPVLRGEKIKAILGVGNKPADYSSKDVEAMALLADLAWEITERKMAEEFIRKLTQAVEQSPVSIVITDVSGKIEFVNAEFTRTTGYSFSEALGQNPRILKSGETPAEEYRRLWKTISSGGVWQGQFQNRKKNGELFWEQATIAPLRDADNVITHYVAVKEDITERKKLEEHLRQIQKMEAIGQLAGGIAHDFNNILSAITGYTELSQSMLDPESPVSNYMAQVLEAGWRAKELINQILMFSRETDQELRPIRISFPVKEALKLIRASVSASIEIRSKILSRASAMADPTQIHQIVMNLCTNAAHAMQEKGGLLEVSLTDITIDSAAKRKNYPDAKTGDYIRLTVADQGYGIDAQYIHRIFDPFFTTKKMGEGTGMGLSVVHGIVKSYGGSIYVHSRLGEGSTFDILFPAQEGAVPSDAILEKPVPTGNESILFVDDETMIVDIVKRTLESLGYRVDARTSARDALETFRNNPDGFDLVVTDMAMPKMSGLDLAEEILQIRPDFPIVLCTGFDVNMNEETIAEHGLQGIVYKPILRRDLAAVVRKTLDNGRMMRDNNDNR
jgi:PAS domain S-box-containing protein